MGDSDIFYSSRLVGSSQIRSRFHHRTHTHKQIFNGKDTMDSEVAYNDSGCSNFRTSLENSEEGACDLHRPRFKTIPHAYMHT